jgi:hypothetical protein
VLDGIKTFKVQSNSSSNERGGIMAKKKAKVVKAVRGLEVEVKLVKFPKEEDKVRGNQLAILEVLKEHGPKMAAAELIKKLKTPTKNKNGQLAVWTFNRPILIDKGFITVSA